MYSDWSVVAPAPGYVAENLVASVALLKGALKFPVAVDRGAEIVAVALPHMWQIRDEAIVHSYGPNAVRSDLPIMDLKFDRDLCLHMAGCRPKKIDDAPAFVSGGDSSDDGEVYIEEGDNPFWVGDDRYDANGMRVYQ